MYSILVPTDFSVVGDYATEYAVKYSKLLNKDITLLHLIKSDAEYQEAEHQIKEKADAVFQKYGIKPKTIVREGSIFTTVGEVSNDLKAEMVIMGTHGRRGVQKFTGMWALKVGVKCKAPFMVVHDFPHKDRIEKIVFPVDFKRENREKLHWAGTLAKMFNAKIYLLKSTSNVNFLGFIKFRDKGFLKRIFFNMNAAEKYFNGLGVEFETSQVEPYSVFAEEINKYSENIGADLIIITTTKSIGIPDYLWGASEQIVIDNPERIPVVCINPKPTLVGSFSATGN